MNLEELLDMLPKEQRENLQSTHKAYQEWMYYIKLKGKTPEDRIRQARKNVLLMARIQMFFESLEK